MGGMFVSTPRLFAPEKNSTWVTLPPSGSEAVAQMLMLAGPRIVAPSRGLVMATRGGRLVTTEMSTTAEVTVLPAWSLAMASRALTIKRARRLPSRHIASLAHWTDL